MKNQFPHADGGPQACEAGAPIVLLHGATSSARAWDTLLPRLSQTHRVFVPTLAGHCGGPHCLPEGRAW